MISEWLDERIEEGEQESAGERDDEEELEAVFPGPEAGALHGKLGLSESPRHLDLPSPRVRVDDLPHGRRRIRDLVGQQVPGFVSFAPA